MNKSTILAALCVALTVAFATGCATKAPEITRQARVIKTSQPRYLAWREVGSLNGTNIVQFSEVELEFRLVTNSTKKAKDTTPPTATAKVEVVVAPEEVKSPKDNKAPAPAPAVKAPEPAPAPAVKAPEPAPAPAVKAPEPAAPAPAA